MNSPNAPGFKTIVVIKLPVNDWPPPGALQVALVEASNAFVGALREALPPRYTKHVIVDIDITAPNPELN